ncbi:MAG: shikimate dehydrogenase [Gemmatimonadales bacterium]|nr:shikimate dehydrogenase [Gemmatimonadales bacterium]
MATGSTRVFAVLGDPVAHSLSPAMHEAAFRTLGLDARYVALRCDARDLAAVMRTLVRQGGGGNVTVPHKASAAAVLERPSALVRTLEACNTFWGDGQGIAGDNTDVVGVRRAMERLAPEDGPWLVLGTGGSAPAVVAAAREAGVALAVRSRDTARAQLFASWARRHGVPPAAPEECVACINATPLGLAAADPLPVAPDELRTARVALDLVYAAGGTRWVRACRLAGLRAADGREVLVEQGAAALERWFPGLHAPRDAMRAAVHARLG